MKKVQTAEIVYPPEVDNNKLRIKRSVKMKTEEDSKSTWEDFRDALAFVGGCVVFLLFIALLMAIFGGGQ